MAETQKLVRRSRTRRRKSVRGEQIKIIVRNEADREAIRLYQARLRRNKQVFSHIAGKLLLSAAEQNFGIDGIRESDEKKRNAGVIAKTVSGVVYARNMYLLSELDKLGSLLWTELEVLNVKLNHLMDALLPDRGKRAHPDLCEDSEWVKTLRAERLDAARVHGRKIVRKENEDANGEGEEN